LPLPQQVRAADGHPQPYRVKYFELGNEQYNGLFVDQVRAMEDRAASIGLGGQLHYLFPDNAYLNPSDLARAKALGLDALADRIMVDLHSSGFGAVGMAELLFNNASFGGVGSGVGAINCETNAKVHTMRRALTEAVDLNQFFNYNRPSTGGGPRPRLKGRMASFCMERSGHLCSDWDQGISFYSADRMWLQPPGWVHAMIHQHWQPYQAFATVATVATHARTDRGIHPIPTPAGVCPGPGCAQSASAAYSVGTPNATANTSDSAGARLVVRYVNPTNASVSVAMTLPAPPAGLVPRVAPSRGGKRAARSALRWVPVELQQLAHADIAVVVGLGDESGPPA